MYQVEHPRKYSLDFVLDCFVPFHQLALGYTQSGCSLSILHRLEDAHRSKHQTQQKRIDVIHLGPTHKFYLSNKIKSKLKQ